MIDVKSSFSSKLIIDILTIKYSAKSLQSDLNPDIIQKIRNLNIPKISQFEIQKIYDQSNAEQIKMLLNNIFLNFHYDSSLLYDISNLQNQNMQTINCLSIVVMYSYISLTLNTENSISDVKPLLNALYYVSKSQYSTILMCITVSLISEFCLHDDEMSIYELMPTIWEYVKIYKCHELIIFVMKHILDDQNDSRFHKFMETLINFIDNYFTDHAIIEILKQFKEFYSTFDINSLKYLIKISNIVNKQILPNIIPFFPIAILDVLKTLDPISIKIPIKNFEADDYYLNSYLVIGEFEFSNISTFPNGFNPSYSINFPKMIDLSTFFTQNLTELFSQIALIIQNDEILIDYFISSFFKVIDKNNLENRIEFNTSVIIAFYFICNEIFRNTTKTISIKSEYAFRFFQPEIFNYSMTIYNNKLNDDDFTDYYQKINTLRSISLDYILCDDGIAIENILLSDASNYPNFVAELFYRLSKMTTVFAHCIYKNQKLIKAILNLAMSYQHLEISIESANKEPIQNARSAIFVTLAHLYSDNNMLSLFFNDSLFLNTFFVFLFEEPIRPFILSILTHYLSKIDLTLPPDISSILYRVFNILNLNLPNHRYLLLLYDLIKSLNSSLTYRQKDLLEFRETTKILCQTMVKINKNESDSELSKKIFKEAISFLILMSPFFEISELEIDALITCILTFKDKEFIYSLYSMFISLLAGQPVTPNSANFDIFQPQIFTLLIQIFCSTPKLNEILKFIYNVISFSPKNLQKCCEINLDLFILKYLENAKVTGNRTDEEVQGFLDLYTLLSISHSSSQSVLSYISLLSPIDSVHVSKYHLKFIDVLDQMVIESSKLPRSTFPLNERVMYVASSTSFSGKENFSKIKSGFSVAFWIFVEPTLNCARIFSLKIGEQIKIGIAISNNVLLIYQNENHSTNSKPVIEELKLHAWTFCAFSFDLSKKLIVVKYLLKQSSNETITENSVTFDHFKTPIDTSKASLKLGGFYQIASSLPSSQNYKMKIRSNFTDSTSLNIQEENNSHCRLGSFGLYELKDVKGFIEIARICFQNSPSSIISPIVYVNDYSEFEETVANGFVDVLACQSGVNMLLPLFLQNDMKTFDDKPFRLSLETILSLLMHILTYSFEAQMNFFQSKGFNIIAQLLTDRWTPFFTVKVHRFLYETLGAIQYEPLQQQLFDEVMTNFTFIQKLDPDLHYRIVKLWPLLFDSFSSIAQNFSSFEDLIVILRLFYWYTPIQAQYIKYVELRSEKLNVQGIRKILFNLLLFYASETFQYAHFQCIIGHCLSCPELKQVIEMIDFLIDVFSEYPDSIRFNVECEPLDALLSYYIRFPDDSIRIQVLKFFITVHQAKKISDEFFQCQIDSIVLILSELKVNRSLFDFLIDNLENEPLLLNLCCYLAIYFNDASFMKTKRVNYHVSKFWAVLPLFLSIYVDDSTTDFVFECGKNELCDIFIQYDIFFERSKRFESIFADKLLEISKKEININDVLEVCKRLILFTPTKEEKTISNKCFSIFTTEEEEKLITKEEEKLTTKEEEKLTTKEEEKLTTKEEEKLIIKEEEKLTAKEEEKLTAKEEEKLTAKDEEKLTTKDEEKLTTKDEEFNEEKTKENKSDVNYFISCFLKKEFKYPQLKFQVQFDEDEKWCHSKLSVLCLSLFEAHYLQSFLPFDILLCSFLQASNFDGIYDHLNCLNLNDKDLSECELVTLPLLQYHLYKSNKKEYIFLNSISNSKNQINPLLFTSKYEILVRQMTPKTYIKKLTDFYNEYVQYKKNIIDHCNYVNNINMSQYVVHSYKQMSQFLERQQFQNDLNIRSWRRLWSALSMERAPWHIESEDDTIISIDSYSSKKKLIFSRDVSACFALVPVKMNKHLPFPLNSNEAEMIDINYDDDYCENRFNLNSRFSKRRGILFNTICNLIIFEEFDEIKKRKKANFELYRSKIILVMIDDFLRGKVFKIPLSSLKYVFRRPNNGIHLLTEYGYSFHIEFEDENIMLNVMNTIYSNLMKCNDRSILLFQNADNKKFFRALSCLDNWKNGKMSNYEYILMLNHCSGRSFNDLDYYPIFPWILNSYSTDSKSLFNTENIRDFNDFTESFRNKKFMSKEAVLTYLNRIEPFNYLSHEIDQFKQKSSMNEMLQYAKENGYEFVPEFYSMPEIVSNSPLSGQIKNAKDNKLANFDLPSWSNNSAIEFIYYHRKILESPNITKVIHLWFDQFFGKGSENELFEIPHPPINFLNRDHHTFLKKRIEISIGSFNFVSGIINEEESPLLFNFQLLCEDGKLVQTTINIQHLNSSCTKHNESVSLSSSDSSIIEQDGNENEIICDYENDGGNNSAKYSYGNYCGYKNGFHFSLPTISELDKHSNSSQNKKKNLSDSSSNLSSYIDHSTPEFNRISSFDNLKHSSQNKNHMNQKIPDLTIMETPLEVGDVWNVSAPFPKSSTPSFVIASDSKFYVARGQAVTIIDLKQKKIHEVNMSGSTITTSPSNLANTITDVSSSASTSTSSFTITSLPSNERQNSAFVSPKSKMAKMTKVPSKNTERPNSFHEESLSTNQSPPITSSVSSSNHQRPRAISAASSFTVTRSSSSPSSSTISIQIESKSRREFSSQLSQLNSISCAAVDGIWIAAGRDNASISIVCNLRSVATVQLYRSSVSACAVSETFNVLACGTVDGALVIYTKNAGRIVKVVDISKSIADNEKSQKSCEKNITAGVVVPKKIIVTPTWGFIVVFCTEIELGVLKKFVCVFTINGEFVRKVDISFEIDFWYCWSSYNGFDYIVFASESGHVYVNEVFYMNNINLSIYNCRDRIVASYFSKQTSSLVLVTSKGKILFSPIVF